MEIFFFRFLSERFSTTEKINLINFLENFWRTLFGIKEFEGNNTKLSLALMHNLNVNEQFYRVNFCSISNSDLIMIPWTFILAFLFHVSQSRIHPHSDREKIHHTKAFCWEILRNKLFFVVFISWHLFLSLQYHMEIN